jgi:ADP-ribose pyrophosphatase YjhB (NUDIX family)
MTNNSIRKLLILAANPRDTPPLRLDQELRDIAEGLKRSDNRDQFILEQRLASRPMDIQRAMLEINPQIVHFSGHGKGIEGLVFENQSGEAQLIEGIGLAGLFRLFQNFVECVVLNGCYSEIQAQAISQHVDYVIGMRRTIGDQAAIAFSVGFYDALGAGRSIEFAYEIGCNAIHMAGLEEYLTPVLLKKPDGKHNELDKSLHRPAFKTNVKINSSEIVTGFDWQTVRQIVFSTYRYVEKEQTTQGFWRRSDLFPTSRTLFGLLVSSTLSDYRTVQRASEWIHKNIQNPREKPDGVAMAVIALDQASKQGVSFPRKLGIERLIQEQNTDGSWNGRFMLDRYSASSTAYCIQALRSYMSSYGESDICQTACYKGVQYLARYFRSLNIQECVSYSEIVNPLQALMLPCYEAWKIIELIDDIDKIIERVLEKCYVQFKANGNTKAVSGMLTLLLTRKENLDRDMMGDILEWLLDARNSNSGWSEHRGEQSEPHQTVMISLPIRQLERIGYHYIPMNIEDRWSLQELPLWKEASKEYSAGAVVFRYFLDGPEILLLKRKNSTWVLPKGHIEEGEEVESTIRRELFEETGIRQFRVIEKIGEFKYLFRPKQCFFGKTVTYYLVEFKNQIGQLEPDLDHEDIRWFRGSCLFPEQE